MAVAGGPPPAPEPLGGALFTRVARGDDLVAVSLLDLSGSQQGRWDEPTGPSSAGEVTVDVLVDRAGDWTADVAVLGRSGGRFAPAAAGRVSHREGTALRFTVPLGDGWAVARLRRRA